MRKNYHLQLSIRGALSQSQRDFNRLARSAKKNDGTAFNPNEFRAELLDLLSKGHEVIPIGKECDNFDKVEGCKGHPVIESEAA